MDLLQLNYITNKKFILKCLSVSHMVKITVKKSFNTIGVTLLQNVKPKVFSQVPQVMQGMSKVVHHPELVPGYSVNHLEVQQGDLPCG